MGRKRRYPNDAAKAKAYRNRKKKRRKQRRTCAIYGCPGLAVRNDPARFCEWHQPFLPFDGPPTPSVAAGLAGLKPLEATPTKA
jgi:hypothetical protein